MRVGEQRRRFKARAWCCCALLALGCEPGVLNPRPEDPGVGSSDHGNGNASSGSPTLPGNSVPPRSGNGDAGPAFVHADGGFDAREPEQDAGPDSPKEPTSRSQ